MDYAKVERLTQAIVIHALGGPGSGPQPGNGIEKPYPKSRDFVPPRQVVNIDEAKEILANRGHTLHESAFDPETKTTSYRVTDSSGNEKKVSAAKVKKYVQTPSDKAGKLF